MTMETHAAMVQVLKSQDYEAIQERAANVQLLDALKENLESFVKLAETTDAIKRTLFYGTDLPYRLRNREVGIELQECLGACTAISTSKGTDRLHAVLGILTEAVEAAEPILANIFEGEELDTVNLMEECGDSQWYWQLMGASSGFTIPQSMDVNEDKLRERFGDKFTEADAVSRNLDKERDILENPAETKEWINNTSGELPIDRDTAIEVILRNGALVDEYKAGSFLWDLSGRDNDVTKWRKL